MFTLTIQFGILSRASPLRKWLCCWRYTVVMTAIVWFSLSPRRDSTRGAHVPSSASPSVSSPAGQAVCALSSWSGSSYACAASGTSGSPFQRQGTSSADGECPAFGSLRTSAHIPSIHIPRAVSGRSDSASHSRSMSHPCTSCPGLSCTASTSRPEHSATPGSSVSRSTPTKYHPAACSSSVAGPDLSRCRRTSGRRYFRSAPPSASGNSSASSSSGTSSPLSPPA